MATTSSIGTAGRTYSTVASWLAAFAAGGWIGEMYNDSQFTGTANFSGQATGASDYIILRAAAGQGFKDNANAQTNALRYNQANGVGVSGSFGYGSAYNVSEDYVTFQGLQIENTALNGFSTIDNNTPGTGNCIISGCILENLTTTTGGGTAAIVRWRAGLLINSLLIARTAAGIHGVSSPYGAPTIVNCTVVRPSDFAASVSGFPFGAPVVKNCAIFGFTTAYTSPASSSDYNCSDVALGTGTHNQASKTYASQFVTTTDAARDFRTKTGADLLNNAVTDTTDIPAANDIVGTSRPQGSAWDIGGWELVVSGAGITASAAWTETQDAWAGSVTLTFPTITANAAWTESRDLWNVTGSVKIDGAAAWTEARDAWAGSVTISAAGIAATGAWTEAQDLWNGVATVALPAITANGAWTERQDIWNGDGGPPALRLLDSNDPGLRKRRKKLEQERQKAFEDANAHRAARRAQVIAAFENIVEGKPQLSEAVAQEIVESLEAEQAPDFAALLNDTKQIRALWNDYVERDDEDVLALL